MFSSSREISSVLALSLVLSGLVGFAGCTAATGEGTRAAGQRRAATPSASCGTLGYEGCCDGDTLRYCSSATGDGGVQIVSSPCGALGCGWSPVFGLYTCAGAIEQDPGGTPRACPASDAGVGEGPPRSDVSADVSSADVSSADVSSADVSSADASDAGGDALDAVSPDGLGFDGLGFDGLGFDGLGFDGLGFDGSDGGGTGVDAAADAAALQVCATIGYVGCCSGDVLRFCVGGALLSLDCTGKPSCGWDTGRGYYACGTGGAAEPTGKYARTCGDVPDGALARDLSGGLEGQVVEAGIADVGADGGGDGNRDLVAEGLGVDGGPDGAAADGRRDAEPGLDVSGFDLLRIDAATPAGDEGGCACTAGAPVGDASSFWLALLFACAVSVRRRY